MSKWSKWQEYGRNVVTGFRSASNWEGSYYGGYQNVLWDHPEITVHLDLEWKGDTGGLTGYTYNKLIKLFLLSAKELNIISNLKKGIKTKKEKNMWTGEYTRCYISKSEVGCLIQFLAGSNIELANMFGHYKDLIEDTQFYFDIPDKPKGNSGRGQSGDKQQDKQEEEKSKGNGKGESGEDKKEKPQDSGNDPGEPNGEDAPGLQKPPDVVQYIEMIIDSIKERKIKAHYCNWLSKIQTDKMAWDVLKPGSSTEFTKYEDLQANQLVDMLDISFDPAEDKVGSLKSGKLDAAKICEIQSGNFNVYYRVEENISTKPFSVCVLIDESGKYCHLV